MAQLRSIAKSSLWVLLTLNILASVIAHGYSGSGVYGGYGGGFGGGFGRGYGGGGGGGGGGGYGGGGGGGYSGGFAGASSSASAGSFGSAGNIAHTGGNFGSEHHQDGADTGVSVTVHKDINLNGVKEGVDNILGGILGTVAHIGGALANGAHAAGGVYTCKNGKCSGNDFELGTEGLGNNGHVGATVGNNAQGGILVGKPPVHHHPGKFRPSGGHAGQAGAGSSAGSFAGANAGAHVSVNGPICNGPSCRPGKHDRHHHNKHRGPQIREEPQCNGPACQNGPKGGFVGGVSVGNTFGINSENQHRGGPPEYSCDGHSCNDKTHPARRPQNENNAHNAPGLIPSIIVHKEVSLDFGGNQNAGASASGNFAPNTGTYECKHGKCAGKDYELGTEGLVGGGGGITVESNVHNGNNKGGCRNGACGNTDGDQGFGGAGGFVQAGGFAGAGSHAGGNFNHDGAVHSGPTNSNAGLGLGLGNIIVGIHGGGVGGGPSTDTGCDSGNCGSNSNYNKANNQGGYGGSYGSSSSFASSFATASASSSASSGSLVKPGGYGR